MTCADTAQGMEKTTMSTGGAEESGLGTLRGRDYPGVRQFSIFSPNRLGQLQNLTKLVESHDLRICALSVADSADCAIIRLVVSEPERCYELLTRSKYEFCEIDLLAVALPDRDKPLLSICSTLLSAEIDIHYCFPLFGQAKGQGVVAFHVSDIETACRVLGQRGFELISENDLE
jgi:hypothetical protein